MIRCDVLAKVFKPMSLMEVYIIISRVCTNYFMLSVIGCILKAASHTRLKAETVAF